MSADLSQRKREVLYAVVHDFIASATPVGSAQIAQRKGISLSSATVRHVMSELEELGFLKQPHSSSGRVPTNQGYQFYVSELMKLKPVTPTEREEIRAQVEAGASEIHEVLKNTCRLVSLRTNQPGLAVAPAVEARSFELVRFVSLKKNLALAVLVSSTGIVENKILELDRPLTQAELDRMSGYLNERLKGLTISQIRHQILLEMKQTQSQYDEILNRALLLGEQTFSDRPPEVHIEGQSRLFSAPDLGTVEAMQKILRALEEKTLLIRILDQSLASPGVKILIGEEIACPEINGLALITSAYSDSEGNKGLLGVIGPTRMNYARIVPLVEYTASLMTDLLNQEKND